MNPAVVFYCYYYIYNTSESFIQGYVFMQKAILILSVSYKHFNESSHQFLTNTLMNQALIRGKISFWMLQNVGLLLLDMSTMWIYVISCVCLAGWLASWPLLTVHPSIHPLYISSTHISFNQILVYLSCLSAPLNRDWLLVLPLTNTTFICYSYL